MPPKSQASLTVERLAYSLPEAAALASVCRATLYREIFEGKLQSIKLRGRRLITAEALKCWIAGIPSEPVAQGRTGHRAKGGRLHEDRQDARAAPRAKPNGERHER